MAAKRKVEPKKQLEASKDEDCKHCGRCRHCGRRDEVPAYAPGYSPNSGSITWTHNPNVTLT